MSDNQTQSTWNRRNDWVIYIYTVSSRLSGSWCDSMIIDLVTSGGHGGDMGEMLMVGADWALRTESANSAWSVTLVTVILRCWGMSSSKASSMESSSPSSSSCKRWWCWWWSCMWSPPAMWLIVTPFCVDRINSLLAVSTWVTGAPRIKIVEKSVIH